MARAAAPLNWLPAHQAHVFYTAAHVDSTIELLSDVLHVYLAADPLQLQPRFTPTTEEVVLHGIDPLPEAVPRLFADAFNQARNMLEHALYAEVEHRLDRELTENEAKAVEVPATKSPEAFGQWCRHPHRRSVGLFDQGSDLASRLERLQPYQRNDSDDHPLRILVEHTNYAKHREPTVAFTRVGRVDVGAVTTAPSAQTAEHQEVVQIGSVLASAPRGRRVEVAVWPQVMVQRPHTGVWRTLMHEVRDIEDWIRRIAMPIVVEGRTDLPTMPPHLDLRRGYSSVEEAWNIAGMVAAADRATHRMTAQALRRDIRDMLVDENGEDARQAAEVWLEGLSDGEVAATFEPVGKAAQRGDSATVARLTDEWRVAIGLARREAADD